MPTPPPINALLAFLPVRDLERTHAFYHGALGLPFTYEAGGCRIYRVTEGGFVGFCERERAETAARVVVTIVSDDVDAWHRRFTERGIETDGSPRDHDGDGIRDLFARDPDGWLVEVQRLHDTDWSTPVHG